MERFTEIWYQIPEILSFITLYTGPLFTPKKTCQNREPEKTKLIQANHKSEATEANVSQGILDIGTKVDFPEGREGSKSEADETEEWKEAWR